MRLAGKHSRQQPWWLLVSVLAYVLLVTVSSAAPAGEAEIQPAFKDHAASSSNDLHVAPFQASERRDPIVTPGDSSTPKLDGTTFLAQDARQPVKSRFTFDKLHLSRLERVQAKLRLVATQKFKAWRTRAQAARVRAWMKLQQAKQRAEAKRLAKFAPQPGEVEFKPVFKLSKDELERVQLPQPLKPSRAEVKEMFDNLTPLQRAQYRARTEFGEFEPTEDLIKFEEARQPRIDAAKAAARAARAQDVGAPLRVSAPAAEPGVVVAGNNPPGSAKLSRTPSSHWDEQYLAKQAKKRIEQGVEEISDVLHARPLVHLPKRSPAGDSPPRGYRFIRVHEYPGQFYRVVLPPNGKRVYHLIDPASHYADESSSGKYWDEMTFAERKQFHKAVPKPALARFNVDYNKEPVRYVNPVNSFVQAERDLVVPGRGPTRLKTYHDGRGGWLYKDTTTDGSRAVAKESLPEHLKQFVTKVLGDEPYRAVVRPYKKRSSLPSEGVEKRGSSFEKRAPTEWTEHPSQWFLGEGYLVLQSPDGRLFFNPWAPHVDRATTPLPFEQLPRSEQRSILKTIPKVKELRENNWDISKVGDGFRVSLNPMDARGRYYLPGREPFSIPVRSKDGRFEFQYPAKSLMRGTHRKWASFQELPEHLQKFLRWQAGVDRNLPWRDILPRLRSRSLPPTMLKKRNDPVEVSTGKSHPQLFNVPSQRLEVLKTRRGYLFGFPSTALTGRTERHARWEALESEDQARVRKAYPKIKELLEGSVDEQTAGLTFAENPLGLHHPLRATVSIPGEEAEPVWMVRKRHPLRPWLKKVVFLRSQPSRFRQAASSIEQLPRYMQRWFWEAHPAIYNEAVEATKKAKHILRKRAPPSFLDARDHADKSLDSNSVHAAGTGKFETFKFRGERVEVYKTPNGGYLLGIQPADRPWKGVVARPWADLTLEQRTRVKEAIPRIEDLLKGSADEKTAGLDFKPWTINAHSVPVSSHSVPGEGAETIRVERQRVRPWLWRKKLIFHRTSLDPPGITSSSFAELPVHLQEWFEEVHPSIHAEALEHALRKRASPPRSSENTTPYERLAGTPDRAPTIRGMQRFAYPGERILIHRQGPQTFAFSFPSSARVNDHFTIAPWHHLSEHDQNKVRQAIPEIESFLADPVRFERAVHPFKTSEPGFEGLPTASHYVRGMEPEFVRVHHTRSRLPPWRKMILFHRFDVTKGRYTSPSFKDLPENIREWFKTEHPSIVREAMGHKLRKRTLSPGSWSDNIRQRLRKRAPPTAPPMQTVAYPGERITMTRARDGTYMFNFLTPDGRSAYMARPWSQLPSEVKKRLSEIGDVRKVAKSTMPVAQARARLVPVADHTFDLAQAYMHPSRPAETIHIQRDANNRIVFQRVHSGRVMAPVKYYDLPEHLRNFLWAKEDLRNILHEATGSVRRFRKRAPGDSKKEASRSFPSQDGLGSSSRLVFPEAEKDPAWRPYILSKRFPFREILYPGEGFEMIKSRDGFRFGLTRELRRGDTIIYQPFERLTAAEKKKIEEAIPDIRERIRQSNAAGRSAVDQPVKAFHFYPDRQPEKIWLTVQHDQPMYNRFERGGAGRLIGQTSYTFEELPGHLQRFLASVKPHG